jgi:hypothetical protein
MEKLKLKPFSKNSSALCLNHLLSIMYPIHLLLTKEKQAGLPVFYFVQFAFRPTKLP